MLVTSNNQFVCILGRFGRVGFDPSADPPVAAAAAAAVADVTFAAVAANLLTLVLLLAVLRVHQRMPLGDRTSRCGQHIGPVAQLCAGRRVAEHHLANWLRCADAIVINHGDDQLHFLHTKCTRERTDGGGGRERKTRAPPHGVKSSLG